jgi:hypothetical protein
MSFVERKAAIAARIRQASVQSSSWAAPAPATSPSSRAWLDLARSSSITPTGSGRGEIITGALVEDASANNDWSQVRVWNVQTSSMGLRPYPVFGFVGPETT